MNDLIKRENKCDPIFVDNCPNCNSDNIAWQSVFDFKYRILCRACGYHTQWHLNSLEKAVEEWNNNQKGEKDERASS